MMTSKLMNWACKTPYGNIVLSLIVFGLPLFLLFSYLDIRTGILTPKRALFTGSVSGAAGLLAGINLWFLATRPLLSRRQRNFGPVGQKATPKADVVPNAANDKPPRAGI
jgi:hypothetical protein